MTKKAKELAYMLLFLLALAAVLSLFSCNPVKKVLQDPKKFEAVKNEVIRRGYCVNDTTIISKSDTIVSIDTVTNTEFSAIYNQDTVYIYANKMHFVTKKIQIRDTIRAIVQDMARIRLLQADSAALSQKAIKYKQMADNRLNWLILAAISLFLYLFLKYKP